MSDLTFTFRLAKTPNDHEVIEYSGPEDYTIQVMYGPSASTIVSSIHIIKPLKPEDYYMTDGDGRGEKRITQNFLRLKSECGGYLVQQAVGEMITINLINIRETKIGLKTELRFDEYIISWRNMRSKFTNIKFDDFYINSIESADCKTALIDAPPPPSVNISKIIPSIQDILKESPSLTVSVTADKKIQITNPESTLLAHIKDNKFSYFMPHVFKGRLTETQEKEIKKILGLLEGGRRKPKRKTNKRRRRTNRV